MLLKQNLNDIVWFHITLNVFPNLPNPRNSTETSTNLSSLNSGGYLSCPGSLGGTSPALSYSPLPGGGSLKDPGGAGGRPLASLAWGSLASLALPSYSLSRSRSLSNSNRSPSRPLDGSLGSLASLNSRGSLSLMSRPSLGSRPSLSSRPSRDSSLGSRRARGSRNSLSRSFLISSLYLAVGDLSSEINFLTGL